MSHLVTDSRVRLELPPDEDGGESWVEIKRRLTLGDFEAIGLAMETEGLDVGSAGSLSRLLERAVVAWSFEEPVTRENIQALSVEAATFIAAEVNRLNPVRTQEERGPLSPPSPSISALRPRSERRRTRR